MKKSKSKPQGELHRDQTEPAKMNASGSNGVAAGFEVGNGSDADAGARESKQSIPASRAVLIGIVVALALGSSFLGGRYIGYNAGFQQGNITATTDIVGTENDPTAPKIYDGAGYIVESVSQEDYDLSFDNTPRTDPSELEWEEFKPSKMGIFREEGLSERILDRSKLPYTHVSQLFLPENYIFRFEMDDGLAIHVHLNSTQIYNDPSNPNVMSIAKLGNNEYALRFNTTLENFGQVISPNFYSNLDEVEVSVVNQYLFETYVDTTVKSDDTVSEKSGADADAKTEQTQTDAETEVKEYLHKNYGIVSEDGTVTVPEDLKDKELQGVDPETHIITDYDAFLKSVMQ